MTRSQFVRLLQTNRMAAIRQIAESQAQGLPHAGLVEMLVALHLGQDTPLHQLDDAVLISEAESQLLIG